MAGDISEHYRVLDTKHGLMLVNKHDGSIPGDLERKGSWSWEELELTRPYAKGIVLDIGANIGTHTLTYVQTADHVYAFEPQPFVYLNLCANLLLNNIIDATPIRAALGAYNGLTNMRIQEPTDLNSPGGVRVGTGEQPVAMRTLDSFEIPNVSFIKIDVEAYELEVLRGAYKTLSRWKPVVYVEIHYERLIQPIMQYMISVGYKPVPTLVTFVEYPDGYTPSGEDMLQVYGYLFFPKVEAIA